MKHTKTKSTLMARHARLFELIRQRNMAHLVNRKIDARRPTDASEVQLFAISAERSLRPPKGRPALL